MKRQTLKPEESGPHWEPLRGARLESGPEETVALLLQPTSQSHRPRLSLLHSAEGPNAFPYPQSCFQNTGSPRQVTARPGRELGLHPSPGLNHTM